MYEINKLLNIKNQIFFKENIVIFRGSIATFFITIIGAGITFALQVILARVLGVKHYGEFAIAFAWLNILAIPSLCGMHLTLLRFFSAYKKDKNWHLLHGIYKRSYQVVVITSITIAILLFFSVVYSESIFTPESKINWYIVALTLPVLSVNMLRRVNLQALKKVAHAGLPEQIIRPLTTALIVIILWKILNNEINASHALIANFIAMCLAFILGFFWLKHTLPKEMFNHEPHYNTKKWLLISMPLLLMSGIVYLLKKVDLVFVGNMMGKEAAGIYSAVSQITVLLVFGLNSVNMIVAPMISELYISNKMKELQKILSFTALGLFLFTIPICLCLIFFGKTILIIFGEKYLAGYSALIILTVGQSINSLSGASAYVMTMTGHQKQAAVIMGIALLISVVLNAVLIPIFGLNGSAFATATATICWNFIMIFYIRKQLCIDPSVFSIVRYKKVL